MKRNAQPMNLDRAMRGLAKNLVFFVLCFALAHVFLSYFVSLPSLATMVRSSPSAHPQAFAWVVGFTAITYLDFAWFREQVCLIICPYGRLQSVMTDRDTVVIGYDKTRGEPRGRATDANAGDCVDCTRCVQVCPTGIDIRNGLQVDCIGCSACVDACDEVMVKLDRPKGLVRYDSLNGFDGKVRRFLRPRVVLYAILGVVGFAVALYASGTRVAFEAHLLRTGGAVFVASDVDVRNPVRLHVVNKRDEPVVVVVTNHSDDPIEAIPSVAQVELEPGEARYIPMMLRVRRDAMQPGRRARFELRIRGEPSERVDVQIPFLGPIGVRHD